MRIMHHSPQEAFSQGTEASADFDMSLSKVLFLHYLFQVSEQHTLGIHHLL